MLPMSLAGLLLTALTVRLLKIQEIPLFLFMTNVILMIHITNVWDGSTSSIRLLEAAIGPKPKEAISPFLLE